MSSTAFRRAGIAALALCAAAGQAAPPGRITLH